MDRKAIKAEAKAKIKGNLWTIWKPMLVVGLIIGVFGGLCGAIFDVESTGYEVATTIVELALMPLTVGLIYYMLNLQIQ